MEEKPDLKEVLSGYTPSRPIGSGGMATIYLYENRLTGETLAVKALHAHVLTEKDSVMRFFHEVKASRRLDHKNIVKVLGYGKIKNQPAMVMEFVDGGDLKNLIEHIDLVPMEIAAYIAYQVFRGLDYSHRLGIVHRDIKPSNILLDRKGNIKITDFGISRVSDLTRLTQSGDVLGTPAYMSPQQAGGERIDERTDLFSMGVVLYEMLTGKNPFLAANPSLTLMSIIRCNPDPVFEYNPSISYRFESAVDTLLARDANSRYETAAEAANVMKSIIAEICPNGFEQEDFQEFLSYPENYANKRKAEDSLFFLESGKEIMSGDDPNDEQAMVEFYRSLFLDPGNIEAKQYLTSITEKFEFSESKKVSAKTLELEESLKENPNNVAILLQLVKRYRQEGNIMRVVFYSKRLARLRPKDAYIISQIQTLLPKDQVTALHSQKTAQFKKDTSKDKTKTYTKTHKTQSKKQQPTQTSTPVKSIHIKRSIEPFWFIIGFVLLIAIGVGIYSGRLFKSTSEHLDREIPLLVDNLMRGSSSERNLDMQAEQELTGEAKALISEAQENLRNGRKRDAINLFEEFITKFPNHTMNMDIRLELANVYFSSGEIDNAIRVIDKAIQTAQDPKKEAEARYRKFQMLNELGRKEDARWEGLYLEPFYKSLESPFTQTEFLHDYAKLCEQIKMPNEALKSCDKIILNYTIREQIIKARLLKAEILSKQGQVLDAKKELKIVRDQTNPQSPYHKKSVEKLKTLNN